jgi:hypothetical protein
MRTPAIIVLDPAAAMSADREASARRAAGEGISTRVLLDLIAAFAIPLSVLMAPLRLGLFDIVRPTLLITLPCVLYLLCSNHGWMDRLLRTRLGLGTLLLFGLFGVGHFFGHDVLDGASSDDAFLSWENVAVMPLVFFSSLLLGCRPEFRAPAAFGLFAGLMIHVVCIVVFPAAVTFHEYDRMAGLLSDPNIVLLHVVPVFFLWLALLRRKRWLALAPFVGSAVVWATLQTLSRAGLASLITGFVVLAVGTLLLLSRSARKGRLLVVLGLAPLVLYGLYLKKPEFFEERLAAYTTRANERAERQGSLLEDRLLWLRDLEHLQLGDHLTHPLGMGYARFQSGNYILPHNTFADVYIISGPVALLIYLAFFAGAPLRFLRRLIAGRPRLLTFHSTAVLACVVTQVLMLFSLSVLTWKVNWLVLGLTSGLFSVIFHESSAETEAAETEPAPLQLVRDE